MARNKLGHRQKDIYRFICTYTEDHGYPPSVREIGNAVGLASPSTVHMHLKTLEELGLIKRDSKKPRTIEVMTEGMSASAAKLAQTSQNVNNSTIKLPLIGKVAAGLPILAEQNVEESLVLPTNVVDDSSSFILRVQGESMIKAGILNGDYIVVREQSVVSDGQIVVALIDDEATVKRFYREKDCIRLQPENDTMQPIYADNPKILGVVTALFRTIR